MPCAGAATATGGANSCAAADYNTSVLFTARVDTWLVVLVESSDKSKLRVDVHG